MSQLPLVLGAALGFVVLPALAWLFRRVTVSVADGEAVLVTSFGALRHTFDRPGLHVHVAGILPWVRHEHVSLKRDFRAVQDIHVNDAKGTALGVELWIELSIVDPARATFHVEDWDRTLRNLVTHAATSILSNRDFADILCDRSELSERLRADVAPECERWGVSIHQVLMRKVSVRDDLSAQMLAAVAARLERAKADIEEAGHLKVAELESETDKRVAVLVAEAKSQYALAVGKALDELRKRPRVAAAYHELHALSLRRPHRTVTFQGFGAALSPQDAAMMVPGEVSSVKPLPDRRDQLLAPTR